MLGVWLGWFFVLGVLGLHGGDGGDERLREREREREKWKREKSIFYWVDILF